MMYKDTLKKIYDEALKSYNFDESHIPDEIKTMFEAAISKGKKFIVIPFDKFNEIRMTNNNLDYILMANGIAVHAEQDGMHLAVNF